VAPYLRPRNLMIDKDAERTVTGWLRLGDRFTGRKPVEGRCDRCGETGYLTDVAKQRLCARCYLEGDVTGP
jgi:hypothetical protein